MLPLRSAQHISSNKEVLAPILTWAVIPAASDSPWKPTEGTWLASEKHKLEALVKGDGVWHFPQAAWAKGVQTLSSFSFGDKS